MARDEQVGAGMIGTDTREISTGEPVTRGLGPQNSHSAYSRVQTPSHIAFVNQPRSFDNRSLLSGLFGPDNWQAKAGRVLGLSNRMVLYMAAGQRSIATRHWSVMRAYAEGRERNILAEHRKRAIELETHYRQALVDLQRARVVLENRQKP